MGNARGAGKATRSSSRPRTSPIRRASAPTVAAPPQRGHEDDGALHPRRPGDDRVPIPHRLPGPYSAPWTIAHDDHRAARLRSLEYSCHGATPRSGTRSPPSAPTRQGRGRGGSQRASAAATAYSSRSTARTGRAEPPRWTSRPTRRASGTRGPLKSQRTVRPRVCSRVKATRSARPSSHPVACGWDGVLVRRSVPPLVQHALLLRWACACDPPVRRGKFSAGASSIDTHVRSRPP